MLSKIQLAMLILFSISIILLVQLDILRFSAYVMMGLALSTASLVVYYKRAELLASESVHVGLFAVTLGYVFYHITRIPVLIVALPVGLLIIYLTGLLVKLGFSIEKASALVVSSTTALSVILIHYALTNMPAEYSLSAIILGDPLLLTRGEAIVAIVVSTVITVLVLVFVKEIVSVSIDPVSVSALGIKTGMYEFLVYTVIGVSTIGLLRLAGYVMEHVLVLLPAIVSSRFSHSLIDHLVNTTLIGVSSSAFGYVLAYWLNTTPTGLTGLLLVLLLVTGFVWGRR